MRTPPDDLMDDVRRELTAWHETHPRASFADMERAVEGHIGRLRAALLAEHTAGVREEQHPACPHCGTTMVPRTRQERRVIVSGDEAIPMERTYVVCPACGTGLFPPG